MGKDTPLRQAIEAGTVGSLVLWGPPGVGKTSLAYLIVANMDAAVERVSAVTAGVKDLRAVIDRAREWQKANKRTVLIVDEIHRFNKAQQDVLLPVVEDGLVTLIGATTENPYFEVIAPLLSRAEVVRLEGLDASAVGKIVDRALASNDGLAGNMKLAAKARQALVQLAGSDARRALNILERVADSARGKKVVNEQAIAAAAHETIIQYDRAGDIHYDTISAFIKSLRGSDVDATLFYLFRMLVAGEDPKFMIRRMYIFASEDIGNADPHALMLVHAAAGALEWVGLPEAEFALAHAAVYLAAAPKSNSVTRAIGAAKEDVRRHGNAPPPAAVGKGVGYKYPHDFPGHVVKQQYRPAVVQKNIYYEPGTEGFEKEVKRRVDAARKILQ